MASVFKISILDDSFQGLCRVRPGLSDLFCAPSLSPGAFPTVGYDTEDGTDTNPGSRSSTVSALSDVSDNHVCHSVHRAMALLAFQKLCGALH